MSIVYENAAKRELPNSEGCMRELCEIVRATKMRPCTRIVPID